MKQPRGPVDRDCDVQEGPREIGILSLRKAVLGNADLWAEILAFPDQDSGQRAGHCAEPGQ